MSMYSTVCVWSPEVQIAEQLDALCDAACMDRKHCGYPHGFELVRGVFAADANYFRPDAFADLLAAQRENSYPWDWSFTWRQEESRSWQVRSACDRDEGMTA